MNDQHEVEWIPPPHLDTGQARLNYLHRPERLLRPPEEGEPPDRDAAVSDESALGNRIEDTEPHAPWSLDEPGEPGGPAPPNDKAA